MLSTTAARAIAAFAASDHTRVSDSAEEVVAWLSTQLRHAMGRNVPKSPMSAIR